MSELAPIILMVYNRPDHTRKTISALKQNKLANQSDLFIYSDAAKDILAIEDVKTVRSIIKDIAGFKSVTIIERKENWGFARSVIDAITMLINQYGKIIEIEDDIVTSPYFLEFMNDALDYYEDKNQVWHISGWNYPINTKGLKDAFFYRMMNGWGFGTWKNRWQYFEKNTDKLITQFSKHDIYRFNINGSYDAWSQVLDNKAKKIDTFAIFWYATIFQKNGLCLNPSLSFVENIGFDGTGERCGVSTVYSNKILSQKQNIDFSTIPIEEDIIALKRIIHFHKKQKNIFLRIRNKVMRIITPPPPNPSKI